MTRTHQHETARPTHDGYDPDEARWLAQLAYSAARPLIVLRRDNSLSARLITYVHDGTRWRCSQDQATPWAQATTALQAALLQQAQDNDEWLHAMEQAGRMAKAALGNQPEMLRILDERVIESRERFPHPWANIPVHKHTQIPRIIERLQQPLSTYEEAVAAINGLDSVVVRRLHEDDIGWPNDQDWLTMLEFPTRCRTCSADAGHHCVGSETDA